jgi:hypothetical protein
MASNAQTKQDNVKVCFTSKRLRTAPTHGVKCDVYQPDIHTLNIALTQTRRTEMTRKKLQKAKVWRDEVVDLLLSLGQRFLVCCSKLLLTVERIFVPEQTC